jgi:hypothetical protein
MLGRPLVWTMLGRRRVVWAVADTGVITRWHCSRRREYRGSRNAHGAKRLRTRIIKTVALDPVANHPSATSVHGPQRRDHGMTEGNAIAFVLSKVWVGIVEWSCQMANNEPAEGALSCLIDL